MKFAVQGGLVILRAVRVTRGTVGELSGARKGRSFPLVDSEFSEFIRISVTDSGIGIPAQGIDELFKPFSQIDSGLGRKFEGTGLGLAMVKLLIELHGGTVAVESALGEGSCFSVWLPLRAVPGLAYAHSPNEPPRALATARVERADREGAQPTRLAAVDQRSPDLR